MKKLMVVIRNLNELLFGFIDGLEDIHNYEHQIYLRVYEVDESLVGELLSVFPKELDSPKDAWVIEDRISKSSKILYDSIEKEKEVDPLDPELIKRKIKKHSFKKERVDDSFNMSLDPMFGKWFSEDDIVDILLTVEETMEQMHKDGVRINKTDAYDIYEQIRYVKFVKMLLGRGQSMNDVERVLMEMEDEEE